MSDNKELISRYYEQVFNGRELDAIGELLGRRADVRGASRAAASRTSTRSPTCTSASTS